MRLLRGPTRYPFPPVMQPFKALITLTSVTVCLVPCADGFVALRSLSVPTSSVLSGTHVSSSISTRRTHSSDYTSRPHGVLMATKGKKRKRRKDAPKDDASTPSAPIIAKLQPESSSSSSRGSNSSPDSTAVVEGASQLGDVLEGDRGVEALFSDDWSDMPANAGMVKSNVSLTIISYHTISHLIISYLINPSCVPRKVGCAMGVFLASLTS